MFDDANWRLVAATIAGLLAVLATVLVADAAGLTGTAAFAAPLLVGVVIGAGIRVAYA